MALLFRLFIGVNDAEEMGSRGRMDDSSSDVNMAGKVRGDNYSNKRSCSWFRVIRTTLAQFTFHEFWTLHTDVITAYNTDCIWLKPQHPSPSSSFEIFLLSPTNDGIPILSHLQQSIQWWGRGLQDVPRSANDAIRGVTQSTTWPEPPESTSRVETS